MLPPGHRITLQDVKTQYLDNRGIGIRRFSELTGISRTRLEHLFTGANNVTEAEVTKFKVAMDGIEQRFQAVAARKQARAEMHERRAQMLKDTLYGNHHVEKIEEGAFVAT
jgi:plasmid maintenance system antidote protein VapI